eukprot:6191852-Pleurochrysis_carterae.AAC.1
MENNEKSAGTYLELECLEMFVASICLGRTGKTEKMLTRRWPRTPVAAAILRAAFAMSGRRWRYMRYWVQPEHRKL